MFERIKEEPMSQSNPRGLGRLFGGSSDAESVAAPSEQQALIEQLQAEIAKLKQSQGRPDFSEISEDDLNRFVAEDAAVIIRAARDRAAKLMEQASQMLANAQSDKEALEQAAEVEARRIRDAATVDEKTSWRSHGNIRGCS